MRRGEARAPSTLCPPVAIPRPAMVDEVDVDPYPLVIVLCVPVPLDDEACSEEGSVAPLRIDGLKPLFGVRELSATDVRLDPGISVPK
jgi:hypothetical protein